MNDMRVITNKHYRQFKYRYEVPAKALAEDFDDLDEDEMDRFFCYRGIWYHTSEFLVFSEEEPYWQGHKALTVFSAVVIRVSVDQEEYQVGLAVS